jgi:Xaa-Pro aminopeptidase
MSSVPAAEHAARQAKLWEALERAGIDALFVPPSSDLEYLTGLARDVPSFGQTQYAHGWVAGAFFAPGREPLFVLPRMVVFYHLGDAPPENTTVVNETDDGRTVFARAAASLGRIRRLGVGARTWGETVIELQRAVSPDETVNGSPLLNRIRRVKSPAELELMAAACRIAEGAMSATLAAMQPGVTMVDLLEEVEHQMRARGSRCPSFPTRVFSFGPGDGHDSDAPSGAEPLPEGEVVMFDFGAVHASGYCSDFGRTVVIGEPTPRYERAYEVMLAAADAGRVAARPGVLAREVNDACRAPIEEAGWGPNFRHRMGHGIGLDVHEQPFLSPEDETPLEAGMTFTDEPSIILLGDFGVRIEDVIVCTEEGGRNLGDHPAGLVATRP